MEKEKKTKKVVKKVEQPQKVEPKKAKNVAKASKPAVVKEQPVKVAPATVEQKPVEQTETKKHKLTLNQDLNLLIGLLSFVTIVSFCFEFVGGTGEILGWELFIFGGKLYSGTFQGLMVVYGLAILTDCILSICVDSENEIFNIVEKVLYMFTFVVNAIVIAVLLSLITNVGIGLIVFFILSIVSAIVKLARIFAQK